MVIAIRIAAAGLALVAQVLASRLIGAEEFGRYALTLVWLLILGHFATFGTNQLVCRYLSAYTTKGHPGWALGLLYFALGLAGSMSIAIAAIGLVVLHSGVLGLPDVTVTLVTMALLFVPLLTLQDYLEAISRGLDKPLLGIAPAFLTRHLALITGVSTAFILGINADAVLVLSFTLAGLLVTVLLQALLLQRSLKRLLGGAKAVFHRSSWLRTVLPIAAIDATEVIFKNGDILILGLFVSPEFVAVYFAATRISQILDYIPYGISAATAQKYAALQAQSDKAGLQHLIAKATLANVALLGVLAVAIGVASPWLLGLFGQGFGTGVDIVIILAAGLFTSALFGPGEDVLNMLGQERACSVVHVAALVVAITLHAVFVPEFGIIGAACTTAFALSLRAVLLSLVAYRRLGLLLPVFTGFRATITQGNPS